MAVNITSNSGLFPLNDVSVRLPSASVQTRHPWKRWASEGEFIYNSSDLASSDVISTHLSFIRAECAVIGRSHGELSRFDPVRRGCDHGNEVS